MWLTGCVHLHDWQRQSARQPVYNWQHGIKTIWIRICIIDTPRHQSTKKMHDLLPFSVHRPRLGNNDGTELESPECICVESLCIRAAVKRIWIYLQPRTALLPTVQDPMYLKVWKGPTGGCLSDSSSDFKINMEPCQKTKIYIRIKEWV